MSLKDPAVKRAVALSVFGELQPDVCNRLIGDSRDTRVPQGYRFMGRDQPAPYRTGLVVSGLLRMYVESADGRQINFRYAGAGYFLGAANHNRYRVLVPTGVQAVTDARVLYLNATLLRATASTDATVACALLDQMTQYQRDVLHLLAGTAFGSIRQRVALHLLNLASVQEKGPLIAPVTQQALADAVGTTRESVARALGELRQIDAIASVRGGILLADPERVASEAQDALGI